MYLLHYSYKPLIFHESVEIEFEKDYVWGIFSQLGRTNVVVFLLEYHDEVGSDNLVG